MEKPRLSASKISTLKSCTWIYWCKYHLKMPDLPNDGRDRGSVTHDTLEILSQPKWKNYAKYILDNNGEVPDSVYRIIKIKAKKLKIDDDENINLILEMLYVAIQYDFFCENNVSLEIEKDFLLESEYYKIRGFIDKLAVYRDGRAIVWDYKTSKKKKSAKEIKFDMQVYIYSLACYKLLKKIPEVKFLFLRFPKQPVQEAIRLTANQLKGFENFLEYMAKIVVEFNKEASCNDLAWYSADRKWLCGKEGLNKEGNTAFICQYRRPGYFYRIYDEDGGVIASSFTKEDLSPKEGQEIKRLFYKGCPAFHRKKISKNTQPNDD